nr:hypothetical protein [Gemmatimonas groenlandica]
MSMELLVEGFAFRQHRVDDRGKFLHNQRAGNRLAFAPLPVLKLGLHLWEILHRADRGVVKRELAIAIAVASAPVPSLATGVVGARHEAANRKGMTDAGKARDTIDLGRQGVRDDLADTIHTRKALRFRRRQDAIAEFVIEAANLRLEQCVLCLV